MNKVEFEICSNVAYSSLLHCISIWLEKQNIMEAKNQSYEITILVALSPFVTSMNPFQPFERVGLKIIKSSEPIEFPLPKKKKRFWLKKQEVCRKSINEFNQNKRHKFGSRKLMILLSPTPWKKIIRKQGT